jgi:hypothetical protein
MKGLSENDDSCLDFFFFEDFVDIQILGRQIADIQNADTKNSEIDYIHHSTYYLNETNPARTLAI